MFIDELWMLHEKIAAKLVVKIRAEQKKIGKARYKVRTPAHPIVLPKFKNPAEPSQTRAGRGKQPRWLQRSLGRGSGSTISASNPEQHKASVSVTFVRLRPFEVAREVGAALTYAWLNL
jgi:DNA-binding protein H-NS